MLATGIVLFIVALWWPASEEHAPTRATHLDEAMPAPVLTTALFERFFSRGEADFADKLLSAMRFQFGGHHEKAADN